MPLKSSKLSAGSSSAEVSTGPKIVATSQTSRFHVDTITTLSQEVRFPLGCMTLFFVIAYRYIPLADRLEASQYFDRKCGSPQRRSFETQGWCALCGA